MKTAEDFIIEKVGEYWWICGKHRPEFIAAAEEYADQQVKNLTMHNVINCVPYQTCPKCGGDGDLLRYNSPALVGMNVPICDVCDGKKIIPMAHCL